MLLTREVFQYKMAFDTSAQSAGLVHDFFVIAGGKFTLVGKKYPAGQFSSLLLSGVGRRAQHHHIGIYIKVIKRHVARVSERNN